MTFTNLQPLTQRYQTIQPQLQKPRVTEVHPKTFNVDVHEHCAFFYLKNSHIHFL